MSRNILNAMNKLFALKGNPNANAIAVITHQDEFYQLSSATKQYLKHQILNFLAKEQNAQNHLGVCTFLMSAYTEYIYDNEIDSAILKLFDKLPNVDLKNKYFWNLVNQSFRKNLATESLLTKIFCRLTKDFNDLFKNINYKFEDTSSKNVIIFTSQLLSEAHSPTRLVLDEYIALKNLGFNPTIFLVEAMPKTSDLPFIRPFCANYTATETGIREFKYKNLTLKVFCHSGDFGIESISTMMQFLNTLQPEFMLAVGGFNVFQEFIASKIPTIMIATNVMLIPSPNSLLVSISEPLSHKQIEALITSNIEPSKYKKIVGLGARLDFLFNEELLEKSILGFNENEILLAIISNRLDSEITGDELEFMHSMTLINNNIHFVIVGDCSQSLSNKILSACSGRAKFTGTVMDIRPILAAVNFLVNTKRLGGGLTAGYALGHGTLVYSIRHGDVSQLIPQEYQSDSYDELVKLITEKIYLRRTDLQALAHQIFKNFPSFTENLEKILMEFKSIKNHFYAHKH